MPGSGPRRFLSPLQPRDTTSAFFLRGCGVVVVSAIQDYWVTDKLRNIQAAYKPIANASWPFSLRPQFVDGIQVGVWQIPGQFPDIPHGLHSTGI